MCVYENLMRIYIYVCRKEEREVVGEIKRGIG